MRTGTYFSYLIAGFISLGILNSEGLSSWLTEDDKKEAFREFKDTATKIVPEEFMKQDYYLYRWLKVYDFDVEKTLEKLQIAIDWRNENNISQIIYENFTASIVHDLPFLLDGTTDKWGRPIFQVLIGHFNLRKITIAAQQVIFRRYITQHLELTERLIYYLRTKGGPAGRNISHAFMIADIQGFNLVATGCWKCMSLLPEAVPIIDSYYPGIMHKIILINTPRIFNTMLNLIKSFMADATKKLLVVYDSEKHAWSEALLEEVSPDQLPDIYGGLLSSKGRSTESTRYKIIKYVEEENEAIVKRKLLEIEAKENQDKENEIELDDKTKISDISDNHIPHHHYTEKLTTEKPEYGNSKIHENDLDSGNEATNEQNASGKHLAGHSSLKEPHRDGQVKVRNDSVDSPSSPNSIKPAHVKRVETHNPTKVKNTARTIKFSSSLSSGLMSLGALIHLMSFLILQTS